jgi:hypothetical protein
MPVFRVSGLVMISLNAEIEAPNEETAREMAEDLYLPGLCHQCAEAGRDDPEEWELSGELDGTPKIESVEER